MIHLYGRIVETSELPIVKEDVMRFLDFIRIQKLDVSYVFYNNLSVFLNFMSTNKSVT